MKITSILAIAALAGIAHSLPLQAQNVTWGPCADITAEAEFTYECGTLEVPLDYGNPAGTKYNLQMLRIPAPTGTARGSILFNFGGPGGPARGALVGQAPLMLAGTGGVFDLIAVDPRGTAPNMLFNCSESPEDLYAIGSGFLANETDQHLENNWAHAGWTAGKCSKVEADIGPYLGTASVARDMMSVVDAIEEDKMLRFWGISYGTTLGQTLAAMFPDRIDRLVLDAVQDVEEYYNSLATYGQWTDSDKVFSAIFSECIRAGPELCPLAASYDDAATLEDAVWQLFDQVRVNPLLVGPQNEVEVTYGALKGMYGSALYGPSSWPAVTLATDYLLKGNISNDAALTAVLAVGATENMADTRPTNQVFLSFMGIQCGDANARAETKEDLRPVYDRLMQTSKIMGDTSFALVSACSRWNFTAAGKYDGPWQNLTTSHPILFLTNTLDGHTPLQSAYRASERFGGSVVLETEQYGHGSTASVSSCNMAVAAAYFVNGTLPEPGTTCQVDVQPYELPTAS